MLVIIAPKIHFNRFRVQLEVFVPWVQLMLPCVQPEVIVLLHRVVRANLLDELAVTRGTLVRDHNAIHRAIAIANPS